MVTSKVRAPFVKRRDGTIPPQTSQPLLPCSRLPAPTSVACGTEGDYACRLLRLPPKHTSLAHSYAVNTTVPACTYHITTHAARAHHHKPQIDGVDCLCLLNLLSIQPCSAASHKCDSRVRHFGGVFGFAAVRRVGPGGVSIYRSGAGMVLTLGSLAPAKCIMECSWLESVCAWV